MLRAAGRLTCRSANRGQRSIFIQAETSRGEEGKIVRILGLESSADDTCAAIVTSDRKILSNVVIRQQDLLGETFSLGSRPLERSMLSQASLQSQRNGAAYIHTMPLPGTSRTWSVAEHDQLGSRFHIIAF